MNRPRETAATSETRLHKYLAACGVASRRKAEELILEGRVKVNGRPVRELGVKIVPGRDRVTVRGRALRPQAKAYYLLHKPRGYVVTARDEHDRRTVMDLLPGGRERVFPVGRLDRDSEGLLVLTNDGDLAYYLTHPSCGVRKTYRVTVEGDVEDGVVARLLEKGIKLGPVKVRPLACRVLRRRKRETELELTVGEGVNREVRRMFASLGHEVRRLVRTRIGPLQLRGLPRGAFRELRPRELEVLERGMKTAAAARETGKKTGPGRGGARRGGRAGKRLGKPDPALAAAGKRSRAGTGGAGGGKKTGAGRARGGGRTRAGGGRARHPLS